MRAKLRLRWHEALLKAGFTATLCEDLSYMYSLEELNQADVAPMYVIISNYVAVRGRGDMFVKPSQNRNPYCFAELLAKTIRAEADMFRNRESFGATIRFGRNERDRSYTLYIDDVPFENQDKALKTLSCAEEHKQRMRRILALLPALARATHLDARKMQQKRT